MKQLVNRLMDELLARVAENVRSGSVDEGDEAGRIYGEETVTGGVTDNVNQRYAQRCHLPWSPPPKSSLFDERRRFNDRRECLYCACKRE